MTPPIASPPNLRVEAPFMTSKLPALNGSISGACSLPHCCPSCLLSSFMIDTLLLCIPLISGLAIEAPVLRKCTPLTSCNASEIDTAARCSNFFLLTPSISCAPASTLELARLTISVKLCKW